MANTLARANQMDSADKERVLADVRKQHLKYQAGIEIRNSKYNMSKIQESWLKIMRSGKTKQLKKDVEIISQNHERDVDRKDAILQMLDRDLDEAEERRQEQHDITEHQSQYELIRNRNIEEDHQMRSNLEEKIDAMREKCGAALTNYRTSTESSTQ